MRVEWETLASLAKAGNTAAASELFARLYPVFRRIASTVRASGHDVDDLTQIAIIRVWERLPRYEPPRSFGAWAKTVGRNAMLSAARRIEWRQADGDQQDRDESTPITYGLPPDWAWDILRPLSERDRADVAERFGLAGTARAGQKMADESARPAAAVREGLRASLVVARKEFEVRYGQTI